VIAVAPHDDHSAKLVEMGCRFLPIEIDNKGTNPARDLSLMSRYRHILKRERPMAYLGYTIKPNVYGSLAAHSLGIPVINNVSGLGTAFIRKSWLTNIVKGLYRTALRRSRIVFFQNEDDRALFADLGLIRPKQTDVLPGSGIDTKTFAPVARVAPAIQGDTRFLLIARLLWDKGIGEYVDAARIVKASHSAAKFGLLGFLDVENRTAVPRSDVEAWVNEGVIEYLGATSDVRPYIAEADCIVLPSYREGTPRTLLEAAAMGKPLIATDVPGCRNVIEDGQNGFLCQARNAQDLAEQMLKFLSLPQSGIAAMGQRSRRKIEEEYDETFVIERYLKELAAIECEMRKDTSA
jgi:glycosyltransferase involved in cell wall biosynthesis